jgi:hypothetical protein
MGAWNGQWKNELAELRVGGICLDCVTKGKLLRYNYVGGVEDRRGGSGDVVIT